MHKMVVVSILHFILKLDLGLLANADGLIIKRTCIISLVLIILINK